MDNQSNLQPSSISAQSDQTLEKKSNFLELSSNQGSVPNQLLITKDAQKNHQKPVMKFEEINLMDSPLMSNIRNFMDQVKSGSDRPQSNASDPTIGLDAQALSLSSDSDKASEDEENGASGVQVEMNLFLVPEGSEDEGRDGDSDEED